jgi:hypothetical protein
VDTNDSYRWDGAKYVRISERVLSAGITDATTVGRSVLTAVDQKAGREALGTPSVYRASRVVIGAGIDLTGATTSDAAFQAILDAAAVDAAASGGTVEVYVPPGVLSLTTRVNVGSGVTLRGAGRGATTVKSSNVNGVLELTGSSDITVADLTVQSTATGTTASGIAATYNGLSKRFSITNCRVTGATNLTGVVKFFYAIEQLTFSENIVEDCNSGFLLLAPDYTTGLISSQISVCNNRFRNVGNNNLQLYGGGPGGVNKGDVSTIQDVEIIGNDLRDFAQTPLHPAVLGPIPIEPTGIRNIVIANNIVDGTATNGISTGNNINMTITGNVIRNQKHFGIELNGGRQISIVGNTVENCTTFATETGYNYRVEQGGGGVDVSDVLIANNVYRGTGLTAPDGFGREVIRFVNAKRVRISDNIFTDWQHEANAVRIGCMMYEVGAGPPSPNFDRTAVQPPPEDCVIEGNTFVITDVNTPLRAIMVHAGLRTNVVRNTVRINRNLVAADSNASVISVMMDPSISDTLVEDNHIHFSGTVTGGPDVAGIGNPAAPAAACAKWTIRRNQVINGPRGYGIRTNSTDLVLFDNDISTCGQTGIVLASPVVPAFRVGSLDVGHASDTTVSRLSAGKIAVENAEVSLTGHKHVAADVTGARSWAAVPASATAAGTAGQEAYDAGFHYVCITTGAAGAAAWKRTPLTAW